MFYAIQHDEVLCEAESIPALKKALLSGPWSFTDEADRTIIIAQKFTTLEVELKTEFKEVKS